MTTWAVGDPVEVIVVTKRGRQPEWIPATVTLVEPLRMEVTFEGGSRQRFVIDTERVRTPGGVGEGEQWVFSIFSRL